MDVVSRLEAENACRALSHAFAFFLDRMDYPNQAAQFAEAGVWIRHGVRLTGRAQIIDAMNKRPVDQFTRHLITNIHFTEFGPDLARAVVCNISYFTSGVEVFPGTIEPEKTMLIEFDDTYVSTDDGWKILERGTRPLLVPENMRKEMVGH